MEVYQSRYGYKRLVHLRQRLRGTQITRSDYEARGGTNCEMPAQAVAVGVYQFPSSRI